MNERYLAWESCNNIRDLGGLKACDGRTTRWKALVRSDSPARLTAQGWSDLYAYGIRTIVTLRTHGMVENELNFMSPYADVEVVQAPIEDITNQEFLQQWVLSELWVTPLYYRDALRLWPKRHAAAIGAIARARPGGVLFHCIRGNDRTGIIALLLLALAGVSANDIALDYALSPDPVHDEILWARGTSSPDTIRDVLVNFDVDRYLLAAGLSQSDLSALRERFLEPR